MLLLVAKTLRVCPMSPGPSWMPLMATVCWPEFSGIGGGFVIVLSVGGWSTAMTVTLKLCEIVVVPPVTVPPFSVTVTVIVAVPLAKATGVKVSRPVGLLGV